MSCPICDDKTDEKFKPFCSRRCADVDLAKWLSGSYAIPSRDPEDTERALEELEKGSLGSAAKPH